MQPVTIKSQGDRINIILDESTNFATLAEHLRKKISDAKQFFEGASTNIAFAGRKLSGPDTAYLLNIITTEAAMQVTLVEYEEPKLTPPTQPLATNTRRAMVEAVVAEAAGEKEVKPTPVTSAPSSVNYDENNTAYYRGGLRSGQRIKFDGSIVILGDANPGSEVVATGNVIVLGALKGMAHAGSLGDRSCFVSALTLQPIQLRIADLITVVPAQTKGKKGEGLKPQVAYVKDGQVFVGPL